MSHDPWLEIADEMAARIDAGDLTSDHLATLRHLIDAALGDGDLGAAQRVCEVMLATLAYEPRGDVEDAPLDVHAIESRLAAITQIARGGISA